MELNSCIYKVDIMHCRVKPKAHRLNTEIYMFYLDLDELPRLEKITGLFGCNRRAVYEFRNRDHLQDDDRPIRQKLEAYLKKQGINTADLKIMLLTNVRVFGYVFNPVSFYYCFDAKGQPLCVVPEIGNTFGEIKPYFFGQDNFHDGKFEDSRTKYYYISPYSDLDINLDFAMKIPDEKLDIRIDDSRDGEKVLYASMRGRRYDFNQKNLLYFGFRYPFVTLKVITQIHWHAVVLFLKRMPLHMKEQQPHLQKEVLRAWHKN